MGIPSIGPVAPGATDGHKTGSAEKIFSKLSESMAFATASLRFQDDEVPSRPFGVMKKSVQFPQSFAGLHASACRPFAGPGTTEDVQHPELISSIAAWPAGAMQRTNVGAGDSSAITEQKAATMPILFMETTHS
jgi:hypothetical protein